MFIWIWYKYMSAFWIIMFLFILYCLSHNCHFLCFLFSWYTVRFHRWFIFFSSFSFVPLPFWCLLSRYCWFFTPGLHYHPSFCSSNIFLPLSFPLLLPPVHLPPLFPARLSCLVYKRFKGLIDGLYGNHLFIDRLLQTSHSSRVSFDVLKDCSVVKDDIVCPIIWIRSVLQWPH